MSTGNIVSIDPSLETVFGIPVFVDVEFRCHSGPNRTYRYSTVEAVIGILKQEDPANWSGVQVS